MADEVKRVGLVFTADGAVDFQKSLSKVNDAAKHNREEFKLVKAQWDETTSAGQKLKDTQKYLVDQTETYSTKVEALEAKLEKLKNAEGDHSKEISKTQSQLNGAKASLLNYEKQLEDVNKELKTGAKQMQEYADKVKSVGDKVSKAGSALTKGVTAPIVAIGTASAAAWSELDEAYDYVATGTGAVGKNLENLQQSFENVYGKFPAQAQEVGVAIADINTRFGFTDTLLENATESFLKYAKVNNTDVATAIETVSKAMYESGESNENYAQFLDYLTSASQNSGLAVDKLANYVAMYGAQTKAMNLSTKDSIALFAQLDKSGVNVEQALSGINKAAANWTKEGKNASTEFENLTAKIKNAKSDTEATALAVENFGTKAGVELADAIRTGRFEFDDFVKTIGNSKGQLNASFEATLDPVDKLQTATNSLKKTGSDLFTSLQKLATPALEKFAKKAESLSKKFSKLDDNEKKSIVKFGLLAAAIGPVVLIIGKLITGIGGLMTALSTMATTLQLSTGAVGALSLALGALVGVIVLVATKSKETSKATKELQDRVDKTSEKIDENVQAWEDVARAQQQYVDEQLTEMSHYQDLWKELQNITDENGKIKQGYEERAKFITTTLSEALGIEITITDGVVQGYQKLQKEIDNTIRKKKAEIILDSQGVKYKEAITNQADALRNMNEAKANKEAIEDEIARKQSEYDEIIGKYNRAIVDPDYAAEVGIIKRNKWLDQANAILQEMSELQKEVDKTETDYNKQLQAVQSYTYAIGVYEDNMVLLEQERYDEISDISWNLVETYQSTGDAIKAQLEDQIKSEETLLGILKQQREKTNSDIFDNQIKSSEEKIAALKEEMKQYVSTTQQGMDEVVSIYKNAFGEIELYKNRKLFEASAEKNNVADPMSRFTQFNFPNELGQQISLNLTIPVTAQIGDDALGTQIIKSEKDMQIRGGGK